MKNENYVYYNLYIICKNSKVREENEHKRGPELAHYKGLGAQLPALGSCVAKKPPSSCEKMRGVISD